MDSDETFRARVAGEVDEKEIGRAGWLWLTRPDGWHDEVARLQHEADAAASAAAAERSERNARRKLKAARAAADKAAARARTHAEESDKLRSDLAEERSRRTAAEQERERLVSELQHASEERRRAVRELKDVEARLAARATEANQAAGRIRELEAELARAGDPAGERDEPQRDVDSRARAALADALHQTADGAHALGQGLNQLARLLNGPPASYDAGAGEPRRRAAPGTDGSTGDGGGSQARGASQARSGGAGNRSRESRTARLPIALPGGIADDSPEAAFHLLKTPGVLVLVDGYNVTMVGWPELPIAEQRARLLSALDETAARSGADVEVIFDGAETEPSAIETYPGRRAVRKRFSPPDVEADDVLLSLLVQIPTARPVVVVSSDNRVRQGARSHGANLIHARQVMELLRR